MIGKFAHLTNSFMNPVAYILLIPEFPRAISELICFNRPYDALAIRQGKHEGKKSRYTNTLFC